MDEPCWLRDLRIPGARPPPGRRGPPPGSSQCSSRGPRHRADLSHADADRQVVPLSERLCRAARRKGSSTTASVDVAGIRMADWIDKVLCDDSWGCAVNASWALRTVSPRNSMSNPRHRYTCRPDGII